MTLRSFARLALLSLGTWVLSITTACEPSDTDAAPDPAASPVASACADLADLHARGELRARIEYTGERGFRFELADLAAAEDVLAECSSLEARVTALLAVVPGAALDWRSPRFHLGLAVGDADKRAPRPMDAAGLFRGASLAKTYLGALATLAVLDGQLDLDNADGAHALGDYLPETLGKIADADRITVRQLLQHTSGIPNYWGDELGPQWLSLVLERHHQGQGVTEDDALGLVYGLPHRFEPGTLPGEYNNTGYLLVGRVLERVFGRPYPEVLRERLLAPLGLAHTFWEKHDAFELGELAHGYRDATPLGESFDDWFDVDQGYGFANGGVVASAADVGVFFRAVPGARGAIPGVDIEALASTMRNPDGPVGLGLVTQGSCFFHGGELTGYESFAFTCPASDVTAVLFVNSSEEAADDALLELSFDLMEGAQGS